MSDAFVELADQLVGVFDVVDLLTVLTSRCVDLLEATAAGILLADQEGNLRVMAASTEEVRLLELFQIQSSEGPCLDSFSSGSVVAAGDLEHDKRWPRFIEVSVAAGFPAICAIPMRLGERVLGGLNLFMDHPMLLDDSEIRLARALADVASIAIVQAELVRESEVIQSQLERALESRILIEQAKGMIAQAAATDMDDAFAKLRAFARRNNRQLTEVARSLAGGELDIRSFVSHSPIRGRQQR